ncbi:uncharacterized protein AB675_3190 [Cyphellophora attinorum]|uniref:Methyltransferase type 11 domain-containing protein n=1 Tax=Cyphellophora attinorum TaxID=1664694 RepID=A0A0N1H146_9EURO|nr:uncharacterized protein AB675_3190 [Phialophora attinorum]KPI37922.1 hypothetical protein AB675_3190 [Phialophora attinorum]
MASELTHPSYKIVPYQPRNMDGPFPYTKAELTPTDRSPDTAFYSQPRFVTHIDDNAIVSLKEYYDSELPQESDSQSVDARRPVRILDICSSWVSHYPPRIVKAASAFYSPASAASTYSPRTEEPPPSQTAAPKSSPIQCYGTGLNASELAANPALNPTASGRARDGEAVAEKRWWVQDLNDESELSPPEQLKTSLGRQPEESPTSPTQYGLFDATTCVVSIDYLTNPTAVLRSILDLTVPNGTVHLAISNRCFPTKAVRRWLEISEQERLEMVGDYLWWSGWREIEIVEVVGQAQGSRWSLSSWNDPLWVVRARKVAEDAPRSTGTVTT